MNQQFNTILVVIPAYNEEESIIEVIKSLKREFLSNILVIDDGSDDETVIRVQREGIKILSHPLNLGKGAALKTGFQYFLQTDFQYLITCDADGQHLAADVKKIADILQKNQYNVILGSRFLKGKNSREVPFIRIIYNQVANKVNSIINGVKFSDTQCGLRGYQRKTVAVLELHSRGLDIDSEILQEIKKKKLSYLEIPIKAIYTKYSLSKGQNLRRGIDTFLKLVAKKLF